jgi:hypothetical protein
MNNAQVSNLIDIDCPVNALKLSKVIIIAEILYIHLGKGYVNEQNIVTSTRIISYYIPDLN